MLIINADDWGRSPNETDVALALYQSGSITSVTAMVFMADSERAAKIAVAQGIPTGLHINLNESFTAAAVAGRLQSNHERIVRFLNSSRYAQLLYNPALRNVFRAVFEAQLAEFVRLYGKPPTHFDGHQHMHLCTNMLLTAPIPSGQKVRRSFSFLRGEKGPLNRAYRNLVSRWLRSRYKTTDYFFALSQHLADERLAYVFKLAAKTNVELMTHPIVQREQVMLQSPEFVQALRSAPLGSYLEL